MPAFTHSLLTTSLRRSFLAALAFLLLAGGWPGWAASLSEIVFSFSGPPGNPVGELVAGPDGDLYGATCGRGGAGTIFEIGLNGLPETVLEVTGNGPRNKGAAPTDELLLASGGNIYGMTSHRGANRGALPYASLVEGATATFTGLPSGEDS